MTIPVTDFEELFLSVKLITQHFEIGTELVKVLHTKQGEWYQNKEGPLSKHFYF